MTWRPISEPPEDTRNGASIRVLGVLDDGLHVFANYTPRYIGRDEMMVWTCEGFGAATKPAYWQPLEPSP
jgi:hypothetical protein